MLNFVHTYFCYSKLRNMAPRIRPKGPWSRSCTLSTCPTPIKVVCTASERRCELCLTNRPVPSHAVEVNPSLRHRISWLPRPGRSHLSRERRHMSCHQSRDMAQQLDYILQYRTYPGLYHKNPFVYFGCQPPLSQPTLHLNDMYIFIATQVEE